MKKYKYITIEDSGVPIHKKPAYTITNNKGGDWLGDIEWYPAWRQYIFCPASIDAVFNNTCLKDIIDFLEHHAGKEAADDKAK